jgi:hypothetical protein
MHGYCPCTDLSKPAYGSQESIPVPYHLGDQFIATILPSSFSFHPPDSWFMRWYESFFGNLACVSVCVGGRGGGVKVFYKLPVKARVFPPIFPSWGRGGEVACMEKTWAEGSRGNPGSCPTWAVAGFYPTKQWILLSPTSCNLCANC